LSIEMETGRCPERSVSVGSPVMGLTKLITGSVTGGSVTGGSVAGGSVTEGSVIGSAVSEETGFDSSCGMVVSGAEVSGALVVTVGVDTSPCWGLLLHEANVQIIPTMARSIDNER